MARRCIRTLIAGMAAAALLLPTVRAIAQSDENAVFRYPARHHPVSDSHGMVVSQNRIATEVGARILAEGGNAIDAAVAVGFALAVTLPRAGNIGGGGFMLVYLADEQRVVAIDYREMAPAAAHATMYLDGDGNPDQRLSRFTRRAAGVPGTVAGLYHAHSRYGSLRWKAVVQPAVDLARRGIVVSPDMAHSLARARERMDAESLRVYYRADGSAYEAGEVLRQPDLGKSLDDIARRGPDAFYKGRIAQRIVADMAANDGLIDAADLAAYRVVEREAVRGTYRGYEIVSMPPPSSGGLHIVQMLNVLEHFPMAEFGPGSADSLHVLAEAMRVAYADRSEYLGDPDFYDVPAQWLTSKDYAAKIAQQIDMAKARPSAEVRPGTPVAAESPDTTHFSVMDSHGNAVANTYTLNFSFGSGITVPGAGFLLNNEMDDFSAKPGVPNAFGLLGGDANAIAAGKRPLSSMTPTMVFRDGKPYIVTGSPGGSRIITTVLQQLVNVLDFDMNAADALSAPRIHHQWYPDVLGVERGFSPDTLRILEQRGHIIAPTPFSMGSLQTIVFADGSYLGAADPRRPDAAAIGPAYIACTKQRAACGN